MTGRHKFSDLEAKMTPDRRARIDRIAEKLANEIDLRSSGPEPLRQALLQLPPSSPQWPYAPGNSPEIGDFR